VLYFVCDCNGKMIKGFNVFVVSLFYYKMWEVEQFEIAQVNYFLEMVFLHFF